MVSEETKPKKQRDEECFINCLPGDLVERVFLRLPVSTLLRCIDVCKQWHKIIRDPQFVASHLQDAPHCALVFFPQESVSGEPYPADAIVIDGAWSQSKSAVPVIGPDDSLCGSCNGLLCLYTKTSTIKIANLATGEHLHLEKPVKNSSGDHFLFYSFGCHPSTKEYKIIHFLGDHVEGRYRPHDVNKFSIIQVYTLGDEKWRDIRTPEALSLNCVKNSGAINVDGIMYWLTEDMVASWQHAIMTFDLNEESFARIELPAVVPEDCAGGGPRRYWIRELDGKISIATAQTYISQPRRLVGHLQIWTLDKAEQRWSQKYNIQYPPDYIPGPNLVHGDKIILPSFGCSLYSYELLGENFNTKLGKIEKLLDFSPHKPGNMQSYIFVKSLVRLDVYKNAGIVSRPKQREGWELKKWETWEQEVSKTEKSWSVVHQNEHDGTASARRNGIGINALLPHLLDDEIRKEIGMKIDQIYPNFPDQQPRPLRRLNGVAQRQDFENLFARMKNWNTITKATRQAMDTIISMMHSAFEDQLVSPISMEKATWDAHYLRFFCDICMEEVNANNRDGGCLSRKGYKNLEDKFAEKTGKRLTKKQFKNKWDALKKEYTGWMELINATGLGWDPETRTMDADNDWWQTHLQYRPEHIKFRYGPPANLTQLGVMFSKAHVIGESSAIPGEEETGADMEAAIPVDDDDDASKKTPNLVKRLKFGGGEKEKESPFYIDYRTALTSLVSFGRGDAGGSCGKGESVPTMKEFISMVRECGINEGTDLMFTASKLAVKKEHRELLAAFDTSEGRLDYIQRIHNEMNK